MNLIKKWAINHYIWIMLLFSILTLLFASVLIFETYRILSENNCFNQTQSSNSIFTNEVNYPKRDEVEIVVKRGNVFRDLVEVLESNKILSKEELNTYLGKNCMSIEGVVFEGKYSLPTPSSAEEVISILTNPYNEWVKTEYRKHKGAMRSPLEIVTIASMIEKEAAEDRERPIIAGVIYNRLNNNMKLQIDATVIYALGKHKSRLSNEDLKINSPYNTYIIYGLPPTPICTPSSESIEAALNPEAHSYFYYVVSGYGSSYHNFSKTYDEHLQNVEEYLSTVKK